MSENNNKPDLLSNFNKLLSGYNRGTVESGFSIDSKPEFKIIYDYLNKNGFSSNLFLYNLETLEICKRPSSSSQGVNYNYSFVSHAGYSPSKNRIEYDDWNYIIHELYHVASSKGRGTYLTGVQTFDKKESKKCATALNEGITDYLTMETDHNYIIKYPLEEFVVRNIVNIYGCDKLKPYFHANGENFIEQFGTQQEDIILIIKSLDNYVRQFEEIAINLQTLPDYEKISNFQNVVRGILNFLRTKINENNVINDEKFKEMVIELFNQKSMDEVKTLLTYFNTDNFIIADDLIISPLEFEPSQDTKTKS